jgi:hypothetical protein
MASEFSATDMATAQAQAFRDGADTGFTAHDMATAAADGFRDGQKVAMTEITNNASGAVAWQLQLPDGRVTLEKAFPLWAAGNGGYAIGDGYTITPLYTAPPAAAVVMPPSPYMPGVEPESLTDYERGEAQGRCDMWAEVARLNPAPTPEVFERSETNDQIAAVMLKHVTPEQQAEAARYAGLRAPKHIPLYEAVTRACSELPDGWTIELRMERGAGWIELYDSEGNQVDFPSNHERLDYTLIDAIEAAQLTAAAPTPEQPAKEQGHD